MDYCISIPEQINLIHSYNYFLYKFSNMNDQIIYVGKTKNLKNRFMNHEVLKNNIIKNIYISPFNDEVEQICKEIYYINLYKNENTLNIKDVYQSFIPNEQINDNWFLVDIDTIIYENCYKQEINLNDWIIYASSTDDETMNKYIVGRTPSKKEKLFMPIINSYPLNIPQCSYQNKDTVIKYCNNLNKKISVCNEQESDLKYEINTSTTNYFVLNLIFDYMTIFELIICDHLFFKLLLDLGYNIDMNKLKKEMTEYYNKFPRDIYDIVINDDFYINIDKNKNRFENKNWKEYV